MNMAKQRYSTQHFSLVLIIVIATGLVARATQITALSLFARHLSFTATSCTNSDRIIQVISDNR